MGSHLQKVGAVEGDRTLGRFVQPADDVEQRRLAGAVGSDQGADLAFIEAEGETVERLDAPETNPHVLDVQQRHVTSPVRSWLGDNS